MCCTRTTFRVVIISVTFWLSQKEHHIPLLLITHILLFLQATGTWFSIDCFTWYTEYYNAQYVSFLGRYLRSSLILLLNRNWTLVVCGVRTYYLYALKEGDSKYTSFLLELSLSSLSLIKSTIILVSLFMSVKKAFYKQNTYADYYTFVVLYFNIK